MGLICNMQGENEDVYKILTSKMLWDRVGQYT